MGNQLTAGMVAALVTPQSIDTWDAELLLDGAAQSSAQEVISFNEPVIITGIFPSIALREDLPVGMRMPTLDDVTLKIARSSGDNRNYTRTLLNGTRTNGRTEQAVLSSFGSPVNGAARLVHWNFDESNPQLTLQASWRRTYSGVQFAPKIFVGLTFFVIRAKDAKELGL